jgi:hypothetical protein
MHKNALNLMLLPPTAGASATTVSALHGLPVS